MTKVMTPTDAVMTAEAQLKELLRSGASDEELNKAQDELDAARAALAQQGQRATQRETLRRDIEKERIAASNAAKARAVQNAEQAVVAVPPVVKIEYADIQVSIKLAGGRDTTIRQACEEAIRRTLRIMAGLHLDDVGRARAAALGTPVPARDVNFVTERLRDELRVADKLGAVTIKAPREQ